MKCRLALLGLLCCLAMLPQLDAQDAKDKDKKEPEKTDITAKVREMNSDKYVAPPTQFRAGHVEVKALGAKAIKKTDTGFTIQLPSGAPIPTPTVYKDKLYVSGGFSTREYFCFNASDGKFVWGMSLDDDGPTSAVCADDIVVFNTESCTIFALDANTGKQLWSFFLGDPLTSTPTIADGKVFTSYPANAGGGAANVKPGTLNKIKNKLKLPGKKEPPAEVDPKAEAAQEPAQQAGGKKNAHASHAFICLELKTGKILWQKWIDSDVMSAPVAVDDEVYATTFSGTVYKFKQKDGEIVSAHRSRATSAPVVVGKNVYWTQRADQGKDDKCAEEIACLDRAKVTQTFATAKREAIYLDAKAQAKSALGKIAQTLDAGNALAPMMGGGDAPYNIGQGSVATMQAFLGSRILPYMNANYNCMGDELVNTDPKDGKIRWKVKLKGDLAKLGGHLAAAPAAAGGQLFVSTVEGEVLQIDPEKGGVTKTYQVRTPVRSQPAIEGGRIYVGTQDGKVVCINTGDARFTGWSTWGANMAHTNIVAAAKE
jgi:Ca-activated chloride channel family protein